MHLKLEHIYFPHYLSSVAGSQILSLFPTNSWKLENLTIQDDDTRRRLFVYR